MALKLFAAAGTAFLVGILALGLSGGGLAHGVLPEPINGIFVIVTWLAWLAFVPLLVAACVATLITLVARPTAPIETARGWPAQDFAQPTWVATPTSVGESDARASQSRRTGVLLVLLLMTIGGAVLFIRAGQRPAPDDVGIGLLLLALGVCAWLVVVGTRIVRFFLRLSRQRQPRNTSRPG